MYGICYIILLYILRLLVKTNTILQGDIPPVSEEHIMGKKDLKSKCKISKMMDSAYWP